jgi:hypothetical protein
MPRREKGVAVGAVLAVFLVMGLAQLRESAAQERRVVAAGIAFELPAGWNAEPPASSMRMAQGTIPGPAGAAQYGVFFFGARGGGSVEDNITRWIGQIDKPVEAQRRGSFSANGLRVTWVEAVGTLKPSTIGMGPTTPQPGSRLLGAVVEGPGGPWFFKIIGPEATVAAARAAFLQMLRGVRAA